MNKFLWIVLLFFQSLSALAPDVPLLYRGKIHPAEAYAKLYSPSVSLEALWKLDCSEEPLNGPIEEWVEKLQGLPEEEIETILEAEMPTRERLSRSGSTFLALPSRAEKGVWLPLKALRTKVYDSKTGSLKPVSNFTLYPDEVYQKIQEKYLSLCLAYSDNALSEIKELNDSLSDTLRNAYFQIAGKTMQKAKGKKLFYPTFNQLFAENLLFQVPFLEMIIFLYLLAVALSYYRIGLFAFIGAFTLHTGYLLLRCYILNRPPVSNMFETLIYVPWIVSGSALVFYRFHKSKILIAMAAFSASVLLFLPIFGVLSDKLENVQAVLDSQFWLTIHVLMVVGSYAFFILGGALAHLYFFTKSYREYLEKTILNLLYVGTGLLVVGTLLGGVWAAQSWGRFWDWDPKESWAFISSCLYVIVVHLYRFKHIGGFGLSIGAILGLQAITFTWYGVNYILGTGLHSYGFGSGGTHYYALFVLFEIGFVILNLSFNRQNDRISPLKY